jgi:hypothetical protein
VKRKAKSEWGIEIGLEDVVSTTISKGGKVKSYDLSGDAVLIHFEVDPNCCSRGRDELNYVAKAVKEVLPAGIKALVSIKGALSLRVHRPPDPEANINVRKCTFSNRKAFEEFRKELNKVAEDLAKSRTKVNLNIIECKIKEGE